MSVSQVLHTMQCSSVLVSAFDDAEAMERYKVHPAHVAVATYFKGITEGRAEADYNI